MSEVLKNLLRIFYTPILRWNILCYGSRFTRLLQWLPYGLLLHILCSILQVLFASPSHLIEMSSVVCGVDRAYTLSNDVLSALTLNGGLSCIIGSFCLFNMTVQQNCNIWSLCTIQYCCFLLIVELHQVWCVCIHVWVARVTCWLSARR